jgi:hypothetical protein
MDDTSLTVRQRELGVQLRELRGLTVEDVAGELLCSATKVIRLETGRRCPNLPDLCVRYGVNQRTRAERRGLAMDAREQGWWIKYDDLNLDPCSDSKQDAEVTEASIRTWCLGYCRPKSMRRTSQEVSTMERDRKMSAGNYLLVSSPTYYITCERGS